MLFLTIFGQIFQLWNDQTPSEKNEHKKTRITFPVCIQRSYKPASVPRPPTHTLHAIHLIHATSQPHSGICLSSQWWPCHIRIITNKHATVHMKDMRFDCFVLRARKVYTQRTNNNIEIESRTNKQKKKTVENKSQNNFAETLEFNWTFNNSK